MSNNEKIELQINWEYLGGVNRDQRQMIPLDGAEINVFNTKLEKVYSSNIKEGKAEVDIPVSDKGMKYSVIIKATHETDFSVIDNGSIYAEQIESEQFNFSGMNEAGNLIFVHNMVNKDIYTPTTGAWSVFHALKDLMAIAKNELSFEPKINNREIYVNDSDGPLYRGEANNGKAAGSISLKSSDLFSWDIIAHEFAHAILYETDALDMSLAAAGAHNGTNQYDYINFDKVSKDKQDEDKSLQKIPALQKKLNELIIDLNDPAKNQDEVHKEIDKVNREIEDVKRNAAPEFIQKHNANLVYHDKERALSVAFSEGCGTWLGLSLLTHSSYKYDAENVEKRIATVGTSKYTRFGTAERDLDLTIDPLYPNYFGEDAEFAIARLLWNITNKKEGEFERVHPEDHINIINDEKYSTAKNRVQIPLNVLFDNIFCDSLGKGRGLKNINEFYQHLFQYYVAMDLQHFGQESSHFEAEKIGKINQLASLFAEFGIAPDIDHSATINAVKWHQYKTGSLPRNDRFDIYIFEESTGQLHLKKSALLIEPEIDQDGTCTYEYILTNADHWEINFCELEQFKRVLITNSPIVKTEPNNNGCPYFSTVAHLIYDGFDSSNLPERIDKEVTIGSIPKDSQLLNPSENIYLQQPNIRPCVRGGIFQLVIDNSGTIRGWYRGWVGYENQIPQFVILVLMPEGYVKAVRFGTPIR